MKLAIHAAAAVGLVLLALAGGCADEESDTAGSPSGTPSPDHSSSATAIPTATGVDPLIQPPTTALPTVGAVTTAPSTEIPADWKTHSDPILGFSIRYPSDLVLTDLTPVPGTGGGYKRVLDFRSPSDSSRGFSIEVIANPSALSPEEWALSQTACLPKTIQRTTLQGYPAILCTEDADGPHPSIVSARGGDIFEVGWTIDAPESDLLISSLQVEASQ